MVGHDDVGRVRIEQVLATDLDAQTARSSDTADDAPRHATPGTGAEPFGDGHDRKGDDEGDHDEDTIGLSPEPRWRRWTTSHERAAHQAILPRDARPNEKVASCRLRTPVPMWQRHPEGLPYRRRVMTPHSGTLVQRSRRLDLDGVDFDAFGVHPLDPATLRCLRYMHDVEHHTTCYLRDVLVTRAHADPEVTAFLACWAYEEHWHGEAIAQVLAIHGEQAGPARVASMRRSLPRGDRLRPLLYLAGSALTPHMVTAHMAWGAVNEWTAQAGYGRLAARHPVLSELLRRIMKQEGRHIDFYASQARDRLDGSRLAQRVTREALRRFWTPVGAGVMPPGEVAFLVRHLFSGADGAQVAARIDRQIDRLPGLSGLELVARAVGSLDGRAHLPVRSEGLGAVSGPQATVLTEDGSRRPRDLVPSGREE